jgi:SPP1 gp7 family putative phage head morphogenesis protein
MKGPTIRPSDRIRREYQAVLEAAIKRMNAEMMTEITRAYAEREAEIVPAEMAGDSFATEWLRELMGNFFDRWQNRFARIAENKGKWFAEQIEKSGTKQIKDILKDIGFTVEFKNSDFVSKALNDVYKENVKLISSIPEKARAQVKEIVKKGIEAGNDRHYIATELQKEFKVTERRAKLITLDQTNKANAAISRARSQEAGITHGFWMHRGGSKIPRPTHVAMHGTRFDLNVGLYDEDVDKDIMPGELVACRCAYRPDLSSFRPQMAQDSVTIKPRAMTYADIIERLANPAGRAA